mmetsp:Transcript_31335/g.73783  ORF Transcript_31335/g.73783 Transcript_31335/m.73783 type:complete len:224 (+) Transcript_31335:303-974(+)
MNEHGQQLFEIFFLQESLLFGADGQDPQRVDYHIVVAFPNFVPFHDLETSGHDIHAAQVFFFDRSVFDRVGNGIEQHPKDVRVPCLDAVSRPYRCESEHAIGGIVQNRELLRLVHDAAGFFPIDRPAQCNPYVLRGRKRAVPDRKFFVGSKQDLDSVAADYRLCHFDGNLSDSFRCIPPERKKVRNDGCASRCTIHVEQVGLEKIQGSCNATVVAKTFHQLPL